eukprot:Protomagalhaensia_sp_Gyna_25__2512@NODE_2414_length_1099_cov_30_769811_g2001_i0_p1_GENE_NODE_2414_length_1099_cov_30_769811_g2001_i0NODE_2414_length_1099_cov_30_769811_g2001_i0_p1_ORF_typecomplete_len318_score17_47_NODE_2414_length_1099_cov_30_769811_g2001_i0961049
MLLTAWIISLVSLGYAYTTMVVSYTCQDDCCATNPECDPNFLASFDSCISSLPPECMVKTERRVSLDHSDIVIGPGTTPQVPQYISFKGENAGLYFHVGKFLHDWPNPISFEEPITVRWNLGSCFDINTGRLFYWPYDSSKYEHPGLFPPSLPSDPIWIYPKNYYTKTELLIPTDLAFQHQWFQGNDSIAFAFLRTYNIAQNLDTFPSWDPLLDGDWSWTREALNSRSERSFVSYSACDFTWRVDGPGGQFLVIDWVSGTNGTTTTSSTTTTTTRRPAGPGDLQGVPTIASNDGASGAPSQLLPLLFVTILSIFLMM